MWERKYHLIHRKRIQDRVNSNKLEPSQHQMSTNFCFGVFCSSGSMVVGVTYFLCTTVCTLCNSCRDDHACMPKCRFTSTSVQGNVYNKHTLTVNITALSRTSHKHTNSAFWFSLQGFWCSDQRATSPHRIILPRLKKNHAQWMIYQFRWCTCRTIILDSGHLAQVWIWVNF